MGNSKRIANNIIAQVISFALNLGINFFLTPYVVKYLGKEVYGFVSLAYSFTNYANIAVVSINGLLSRYVTINIKQGKYENANRYFASVTIINIIFALVLVIPSAILIIFLDHVINIPSGFTGDIKVLWAFIFASTLLSIATTSFHVSTFASNRLDLEGIRNMQNYIIRCVMLLVMFTILSPHVWYVGLTALVCNIYLIYVTYRYLRELTPQLKISRRYFDFNSVKELFLNGIWNSINQLAAILLDGLDLIIANLFIGALEMSLMSYSKTIPIQLINLVAMISNTFVPQMTMTYAEGNTDKFIKETNRAVKLCSFLCSVPVIGFIVFGYSFFRLWLPSLTDHEIALIQLLSVLTLLPALFNIFSYPLSAVQTITCKLRLPVIITLVIGIVNFICVIILLNTTNLGILGIKLVSSVLLMFRVLFFTPMYAAHNLGVKLTTFYPIIVKGTITNAVTIIIFVGYIFVVDVSSWISLALSAAICGFIGYGINYIFLLDKSEKHYIRTLIYEKLHRC